MNYVGWALLALVSYSMFTPLASLATNDIPSEVVALVVNGMLVVAAFGVVVHSGDGLVRYLGQDSAKYMVGAGLFLTVGILSYYRALSMGPVSVVVPIFGMFIVGSSILGMVFLGETVTARKLVGITLAAAGVYLVVR